jgi:hypothetical protein
MGILKSIIDYELKQNFWKRANFELWSGGSEGTSYTVEPGRTIDINYNFDICKFCLKRLFI